MKLKKYTETQLKEIIVDCFSLRETLKRLGIAPAGGNYETLKKAIDFFKINISHFTGRGHLKGKTHNFKTRPIDTILINQKYENTWRLRKRLIQEGLKNKCCENCSLSKWMGVDIPLELHHKDGNRKNNQLSNLDLLCPNCHAIIEVKTKRCRDLTDATYG